MIPGFWESMIGPSHLAQSLARDVRAADFADQLELLAGTSTLDQLWKSDYYAGVTNDEHRRHSEHGAPQMFYIDCLDNETAVLVERILEKRGYDTGGQHEPGTKETTVVYIYRKRR